MCHADQQWTEALPLILLGVRTSYKPDLQASVAELMYGEPLWILGELLTPNDRPVEHAHITQLRQHMAHLRPVPATHHANPGTFTHKDLANCTLGFLQQDSIHQASEPPYSGPYQIVSRKEKTLQLLVCGKPTTVSTDRVKPAYMLTEANYWNNIHNPTSKQPPTTPIPIPTTRTTRSGRHVHFPVCFTPWASISAGGGGWCGSLPWEPPTGYPNRYRSYIFSGDNNPHLLSCSCLHWSTSSC
jgi:hypothetical protein